MPIEKKDIFKTPTKSRTPKKIFRKLQYNIIGKSTTIVSNYDYKIFMICSQLHSILIQIYSIYTIGLIRKCCLYVF